MQKEEGSRRKQSTAKTNCTRALGDPWIKTDSEGVHHRPVLPGPALSTDNLGDFRVTIDADEYWSRVAEQYNGAARDGPPKHGCEGGKVRR